MRVRRFSLPLSSPLRTARGEIDEREGFLVGVDGDGVGEGGVGEATPLPGWTESLPACEAALDGDARRPAVSDETDPREAMDSRAALDPRVTPAARHAVALAHDDAAARDAGRPLAARLAERADLPTPATSVPVNATVGDGSPTETVSAAERAVADGYDSIKLKVGARSIDADVERLRAVREAVGPTVELRADANGAWDRERARRALYRLAPVGLAYVEQPLPADDLSGTARLRANSSVPIAVDESLAAHRVDSILAADAADVAVLKPMALGGPDLAVTAAKRAREAGVEPVVTTTIDAVVARTAAVHVAATIPDVAACGLATGGLLAADLAPDPCPVTDGRMAVPEGPGLAGGAFADLW